MPPTPMMRWRNADACVIVPAFNEEAVVGGVIRDLREVFEHVIVVDDGSTDATAAVAREAGALVIQHSQNAGQGAALQTGFDFALVHLDIDYAITFDSDGQHRVEDACAMLAFARVRRVDAVLGSRFLRDAVDVPKARRLLLRLATLVTRVTTGLALTDSHNGLRVLSRRAISELDLRCTGMAHASELLHKVAESQWRYEEFPTSVRYTTYSMTKGQPGINALNVLFELALTRILTAK